MKKNTIYYTIEFSNGATNKEIEEYKIYKEYVIKEINSAINNKNVKQPNKNIYATKNENLQKLY